MKQTAALVLALALGGCVTKGARVAVPLHEGMTKRQVMAAWGEPGAVQRYEGVEILAYGGGLRRPDYYVVLTHGQVTSYGHGRVHHFNHAGAGSYVVVPARPPVGY